MKINWKLRLQNKVTLMAILVAVIALVYQVLGLLGVVASISQSSVVELAGMVINLLVLLGVVIDPTTDGASDSVRALTYERPQK